MRYRRLGRTNLQVSEVGFGAWAIGGNDTRLPMFLESLSQQLFAEPVGIEISRIKKGAPQLQRPRHSAQRFGVVCRAIAVAVLIATDSPGAKANFRNLQICPP